MNINQFCDDLISLAERFRIASQRSSQKDKGSLETLDGDRKRVQILTEAISEAVLKLEKTKHAFKSKQIQEVRETLQSVLHV